jgi:hypothetical protein
MMSAPQYPKSITIAVVSLPFVLFGAYIAYLIVPEILAVVVPAVVQTVVTQ